MSNITPLKEWKWVSCSDCSWKNCPGQHLMVRLPTGVWWDIDTRAKNCSAKHDYHHRCWIRWGELPFITVNKDSKSVVGDYGQLETCDAGAGSIFMRYPTPWHGFLRNGSFYEEPLDFDPPHPL